MPELILTWLPVSDNHVFIELAFCRAVCYLVCGALHRALSLTVGGWSLPSRRGSALSERGGGDAMQITYSDLFQFCLVIIGIISLFIQAKKK